MNSTTSLRSFVLWALGFQLNIALRFCFFQLSAMSHQLKKYPMPIREWSVDDRPREKLLKYGEHTLSNAELLAIMIRKGAPEKRSVEIGRQ